MRGRCGDRDAGLSSGHVAEAMTDSDTGPKSRNGLRANASGFADSELQIPLIFEAKYLRARLCVPGGPEKERQSTVIWPLDVGNQRSDIDGPFLDDNHPPETGSTKATSSPFRVGSSGSAHS